MDMVDAIRAQLAQTGAGVLPKGGAAWLRAHPKPAQRLYEELLELEPNEYVEFAFAMIGSVWGGDEDQASERLGYTLHEFGECADVSFQWTGRWRIVAIPWDYLPAGGQAE
ncbi:MAG: hypothetical protein M0Z36_06005 [Thermaerobacter sp.]|nr:hypothetical protein [Thermaerobacter sp.]